MTKVFFIVCHFPLCQRRHSEIKTNLKYNIFGVSLNIVIKTAQQRLRWFYYGTKQSILTAQ